VAGGAERFELNPTPLTLSAMESRKITTAIAIPPAIACRKCLRIHRDRRARAGPANRRVRRALLTVPRAVLKMAETDAAGGLQRGASAAQLDGSEAVQER